ncbi:MAG: hypothetical protein ACJ8GN_16360 [Longimicrobiaceae bacterium]
MQRLALALAALPLVACDPPPPEPRPAPTPAGADVGVQPARITVRDLRRLRWIEGSWRGSGVGQAPFYERYRFADDSTLVVDSFADSTLASVTDSTRFELRGARLGNPGTVRWVASRLDDRAVDFVPVAGARNTFTWRYDSRDQWTALLHWPASDTRPARDATYTMVRMR